MSRRYKRIKQSKKSVKRSRVRSPKKSMKRSPQTSRKGVKLYTLYKSTLPGKKFDVYVKNKKTGGVKKVSFGATGYEDYTTHKDIDRRQRYRNRHRGDKIRDPTYAGFWSWHILWGESTSISQNMKNVQKYL